MSDEDIKTAQSKSLNSGSYKYTTHFDHIKYSKEHNMIVSQFNQELVHYIEKNYKEVDRVGIFSIYSKE